MRIAIILLLSAAAAGGYYYYNTRPGPLERAGSIADEGVDKTKRVIKILTE